MSETFIHPLAVVQTRKIGAGTRIGRDAVVQAEASIGSECNIYSGCLIESGAIIGSQVTIKSGVRLLGGLRVADDVFIGANVSFVCNRSQHGRQNENFETVIEEGAFIGSGAVISIGIRVGAHAMIAAGAVVTRSVPPNAVVAGNPEKIINHKDADTSNNTLAPAFDAEKFVGVYPTEIAGVTLHRMNYISDKRGVLTVGEFERSIPFAVKRYFMVFDVPHMATRGEHAHKECHQFLICIRGNCTVVADDGLNRREFILNQPYLGIHLPPMTWGVQCNYSPDAILLVFASHYYEANDYINDYKYFLEISR